MPNSMQVTGSTTLSQLRAFTDGLDPGAKLRGRDNGDGTFTLYEGKSGTGLKNALFNTSEARNAAAQDAVRMVLDAVSGGRVDAAMQHVTGLLPQAGGRISAGSLLGVLDAAAGVRDVAADGGRGVAAAAADLVALVDAGRVHPDAARHAATELGNALAEQLRGGSALQQEAHALKPEHQLFNELTRLINQHGGTSDTFALGFPALPEQAREIVREAALLAVSQLDNRLLDTGNVVVGGTEYTFEKSFDSGSNGVVRLFKEANPADPNNPERIVLKTQVRATDDQDDGVLLQGRFEGARVEVTMHRNGLSGTAPNDGIVGLEGAIRTAGGELMWAIEYGAKGDADAVREKVDASTDLSPREKALAHLTMVRDMATGLKQFVEDRGMLHLDVKGMNFFVGEDGTAKLGDFGTVVVGDSHMTQQPIIAAPHWKSPARIEGRATLAQQADDRKARFDAVGRAARQELDAVTGLNTQEKANLKKAMSANINKMEAATPLEGYEVDRRDDVWSLGVVLYQAMTEGSFPFYDVLMTKIELKIKTFAANPDNRISLPDSAAPALSADERDLVNDLLGRMLSPDPDDRPTFGQILSDPALTIVGVGGPAIRQVLAGL